ncbi:MAG TPA: sialidase family protein [Armatimonadota bacterium]|nr:sialidase family protein [Armatimonadota bacterium]
MRLKSKQVFIPSPGPGALVYGNSFYTRRDGVEKMAVRMVETRSDLMDAVEIAFSRDNGRTWSAWEARDCVAQTPQGLHRRVPAPGFVDPETDRLITIVLEGTLPTDDPLEGMTTYYLSYQVSTDGGRTNQVDEQIIQQGDYAPEHPLDGVWVGKNAIITGSRPYFRSRDGRLLFPMQVTPLGPDGEYWNPGGGATYTEAVVLIGAWREGLRMRWEVSQRVALEPAKSTRGAIEPTVAEMPDGRLLMVMRGSNDANLALPGCKWYAVSTDGGCAWSAPQPWTYDDGGGFYSPSSISLLLRHSNGRCYWLGNITPDNPRGNQPRYPLIIGEVDRANLLLIRDRVVVVDDRRPHDDPSLQLSNFDAHEDRENGDIILHVSRFDANAWHGDAYLYRLAPE